MQYTVTIASYVAGTLGYKYERIISLPSRNVDLGGSKSVRKEGARGNSTVWRVGRPAAVHLERCSSCAGLGLGSDRSRAHLGFCSRT